MQLDLFEKSPAVLHRRRLRELLDAADAPGEGESLYDWAVRIAEREHRECRKREERAAKRARKKHPTARDGRV